MRDLITLVEQQTLHRRLRVAFDDLPKAVQMDIAANLSDHHPFFIEHRYDPHHVLGVLAGLVDPPIVTVGMADVEALARTMDRRNSVSAVAKYAGMLERPGFEFDPILVAGGRFYDGGHRLEAYVATGRKLIPVVEVGPFVNAPYEKWEAWVDGEDVVFEAANETLVESAWKPRYGYHVAASKHRASIRQHGIKPTSNGFAYVWDDERMAEWFRTFQWDDRSSGRDIYKVKLDGLNLKPDPETRDMLQWSSEFEHDPSLMAFERDGGGWMVSGGVPPDQVIGIRENGGDGWEMVSDVSLDDLYGRN